MKHFGKESVYFIFRAAARPNPGAEHEQRLRSRHRCDRYRFRGAARIRRTAGFGRVGFSGFGAESGTKSRTETGKFCIPRKTRPPRNPPKNLGWVSDNNETRYYDTENHFVTGMNTIKGKKYYFNNDGILQRGILKIGTAYYYADGKGVIRTAKGRFRWKSNTYYCNKGGKLTTKKMVKSGSITTISIPPPRRKPRRLNTTMSPSVPTRRPVPSPRSNTAGQATVRTITKNIF